MDYFPYGKILREFIKTSEKYVTIRHERDSETDLDYRGARFYDSNVARFLSLDPAAAEYPSLSDYCYVAGNPVLFIDPDGKNVESTHLDKDGNVITVINDGDVGVYQHGDNADGSKPTESMIKKRQETYSSTSANGVKIGETQHWDEFVKPETGKPLYGHKILVGQNYDGKIAELHKQAEGMNLKDIGQESKPGKSFDIKSHDGYKNTGALLNGKYVTIRSAGNFLAGYNSQGGTLLGVSISFETFQKLAGALHIESSNGGRLSKWEMADIVLLGSTSTLSDPSKFVAPTWGENMYQYRMSKAGWEFGNKKP
jgi:RHS repeat-associated protein